MALKHHVGIVLKKYYPNIGRYSIFDRHEGKIDCFSDDTIICGSLISYDVIKRFSTYKVKNINILDVPFDLARQDLLFLHHIFELSFYFLSVGAASLNSFELLLMMYDSFKNFKNSFFKKIFLFKLLVSFGYYSDYAPISTKVFHRLCLESIDSIVDSNLHLEIERSIDEWLYLCIVAHPYCKDFKTVHFLTKIRLI